MVPIWWQNSLEVAKLGVRGEKLRPELQKTNPIILREGRWWTKKDSKFLLNELYDASSELVYELQATFHIDWNLYAILQSAGNWILILWRQWRSFFFVWLRRVRRRLFNGRRRGWLPGPDSRLLIVGNNDVELSDRVGRRGVKAKF
jgi:hypothetical protein